MRNCAMTEGDQTHEDEKDAGDCPRQRDAMWSFLYF